MDRKIHDEVYWSRKQQAEFKLKKHEPKSDSSAEEWQAEFTEKMAAKYEKRVKEVEAECQAKVEGILEIIGEDFVEIVANFYMNNKNRAKSFELWRSIKKRVLKEQEGVK